MASRLNPVTRSDGGTNYWLKPPDGGAAKIVPSVSGLVKTLHPFDNERWTTSRIAEEIADHWEEIEEASPTARVDMLTQLAREGLAEARDFGKAVHHYCEMLWSGEQVTVPDRYVDHVTAVLEWWRAEKINVMLAEVHCFADRDDFKGGAVAGRADLIVKHPNRGVGLLDLKSWMARSSGFASTDAWAMQLAAYADMDFVVIDGDDITMPTIDWHAVLHVGPSGAHLYTPTAGSMQRALDRVHAARFLKSLPKPKMETQS